MRRCVRALSDIVWYVRWVLAGRPPVHLDVFLTEISVSYLDTIGDDTYATEP
jgi:hypothetical protein